MEPSNTIWLNSTDSARKRAVIDKQIALVTSPANMLCSYPRSGSIWLRSMLYDYNALLLGKSIRQSRPRDLFRFSPQIEVTKFPETYLNNKYKKIIIKTHLGVNRFKHVANNKKMALLFRNPADCFVSTYKKRASQAYKGNLIGNNKRNFERISKIILTKGVDKYCLSIMQSWVRHSRSFLEFSRENEEQMFFLSYEQLTATPRSSLSRLLEFYGFSITLTLVDRVIENRSFENMKNHTASELGEINISRGIVGTSLNELSETTINEINSKCEPIYEKLLDMEKYYNSAISD